MQTTVAERGADLRADPLDARTEAFRPRRVREVIQMHGVMVTHAESATATGSPLGVSPRGGTSRSGAQPSSSLRNTGQLAAKP
jgi:hypothetical protein